MNISEELQKLTSLRQSGSLTEEEFVAAKHRVLSGSTLASATGESLGRAANRYITFQIVSAVVSLVIFLVVLYTVILPYFFPSESSVQIHMPDKP